LIPKHNRIFPAPCVLWNSRVFLFPQVSESAFDTESDKLHLLTKNNNRAISRRFKMNKRKMYTIKEAAQLIDGINEFRIRTMCRTGELRAFKAGRKFLIAEDDLYAAVFGANSITDSIPVENGGAD